MKAAYRFANFTRCAHKSAFLFMKRSSHFSPLKCFKALDDVLDVKPEEMHLSKNKHPQNEMPLKRDKNINKGAQSKE